MCSRRISRSSSGVKLPCSSHTGFWLCQSRAWPRTCCPCSSAKATTASAAAKSYWSRPGWMSSHFIWFSGVTELNSAASTPRYTSSSPNGFGVSVCRWWPPPAAAAPITTPSGATSRRVSCGSRADAAGARASVDDPPPPPQPTSSADARATTPTSARRRPNGRSAVDQDASCCTISAEPGQCVAGPHHRAVVDELEAGWWAGEEQLVEIRRPRRVGEPQPLPCCDSEGLQHPAAALHGHHDHHLAVAQPAGVRPQPVDLGGPLHLPIEQPEAGHLRLAAGDDHRPVLTDQRLPAVQRIRPQVVARRDVDREQGPLGLVRQDDAGL